MASFDATSSTSSAPPDVWSAVERACLARFLPALAKNALEESMEKAGIERRKTAAAAAAAAAAASVSDASKDTEELGCRVENGRLTIGN